MPHTVCDKMWLTIRSKYFLFISSISCVKRIITTRKLFLCSFSVYRYGNLSFFVITRAPVVLNGEREWWKNRKIRISRKHHMISQSRDIWYIIWQDFHLFYISHYGQPTYGFEVFNPRTIPEGFDFLSMQNWSFFESTSPSWSITSSQELQLIGIFDPNFTFISFKNSFFFTTFSHSGP